MNFEPCRACGTPAHAIYRADQRNDWRCAACGAVGSGTGEMQDVGAALADMSRRETREKMLGQAMADPRRSVSASLTKHLDKCDQSLASGYAMEVAREEEKTDLTRAGLLASLPDRVQEQVAARHVMIVSKEGDFSSIPESHVAASMASGFWRVANTEENLNIKNNGAPLIRRGDVLLTLGAEISAAAKRLLDLEAFEVRVNDAAKSPAAWLALRAELTGSGR